MKWRKLSKLGKGYWNKELADRLNDDIRFRVEFMRWRMKHPDPKIAGMQTNGKRESLQRLCNKRGLTEISVFISEYDEHEEIRKLGEQVQISTARGRPKLMGEPEPMTTQVPKWLADWARAQVAKNRISKAALLRFALGKLAGVEGDELSNVLQTPESPANLKLPKNVMSKDESSLRGTTIVTISVPLRVAAAVDRMVAEKNMKRSTVYSEVLLRGLGEKPA